MIHDSIVTYWNKGLNIPDHTIQGIKSVRMVYQIYPDSHRGPNTQVQLEDQTPRAFVWLHLIVKGVNN